MKSNIVNSDVKININFNKKKCPFCSCNINSIHKYKLLCKQVDRSLIRSNNLTQFIKK